MKNKFLIILLLFTICFVVTGCGLKSDKTINDIEEFTYVIPAGLTTVLSEDNGSRVLHDKANKCYITFSANIWSTKPISSKMLVDDELAGTIGSYNAAGFYNNTQTILVDGHEWAYNDSARDSEHKIYVYATIGKLYDNPDDYYDGYNRANYYLFSASDYNPDSGICKGYMDSIINSIKYRDNY